VKPGWSMQHPRITNKQTVFNNKDVAMKYCFHVEHNIMFRHVQIKTRQKKNEHPYAFLQTFQMQLANHLYRQDMF
jgi:hypothetical protein